MSESNDIGKQPTFFQQLNTYVGVVVNGVEVSILVFCVAALGILLIANVFARTFFQSIYFAEEVSTFLVMLCTFTGVSYGVRKARHIRMGAFRRHAAKNGEDVYYYHLNHQCNRYGDHDVGFLRVSGQCHE